MEIDLRFWNDQRESDVLRASLMATKQSALHKVHHENLLFTVLYINLQCGSLRPNRPHHSHLPPNHRASDLRGSFPTPV